MINAKHKAQLWKNYQCDMVSSMLLKSYLGMNSQDRKEFIGYKSDKKGKRKHSLQKKDTANISEWGLL